jgi:CheY-like chemotaxis protein
MDDQQWSQGRERAGLRGEPVPGETEQSPESFLSHGIILVAENESTNRLLMEQILRFAGYKCCTASNGQEALDLLETTQVDMALLDLSMPVLDGYATTRLIRQRPDGADLPIIAVTAHALGTDRDHALHEGFTDYLTKPFRPRDLLRIVERYLRVS